MSARAEPAAPRVVLVDDTADLRQLLRIALRRAGYDVVGEAGDGREGIEVARAQDPDLVLLDLSMPVMDGLAALPVIRSACPDATIVVLSGFGAQQMSERALAGGADGYVQKGASLATIIEYVGDLLARRATSAPAVAEAARTPATTRDLLDLAPVAVLEVGDDAQLRVGYANAAAQRLLGPGLAAGAALAEVSPGLAAAVAARRLEAESVFDLEIGAGRAQVTQLRAAGSLALYLDATAEGIGVLRRAIATTAHEMRGPVSVICGTAETLAWADDGDIDRSQLAQLAESMARQARILDGITTDLLTAAQVQRGTLRLDLQQLAPAELVRSLLAGHDDVTVTVTDERLVAADPLRLEQMLTNLVTNARKYGRPPIEVRVRPDGDRVALDVADKGDGVPAEFRDRLFEEFARAESAAAAGTGLGLYVVRALAEAQGGAVSYAPGTDGGSVFTVVLPAV